MPKATNTVPIRAAISEDDLNAQLWGLASSASDVASGVFGSDPRGSLNDVCWPADGGRITYLRTSPWAGATALYCDFRLNRGLDVCLDPRDELLLTFFLSGDAHGQVGQDARRPWSFKRNRALLRTPNRQGGYAIHLEGACRNFFVQFRLKRHLIPQWLSQLGVALNAMQLNQLVGLSDGTILCNASLTSRLRACLSRIESEDSKCMGFAPLLHARGVELLTYVLLDLPELLKPARSGEQERTFGDYRAIKVRASIDEHPGFDWSVPLLSSSVDCTEQRLQKSFRELTGLSIHQYLRNARLDLSAKLLRETSLPVSNVADEAGWECHGRFAVAFKSRFGETPRDFRARGIASDPSA